METLKRARALQVDQNSVSVPKCDQTGDFEPIQCDPVTGNCYCVDKSGFELGGTRARSIELVNCSSNIYNILISFNLIFHYWPTYLLVNAFTCSIHHNDKNIIWITLLNNGNRTQTVCWIAVPDAVSVRLWVGWRGLSVVPMSRSLPWDQMPRFGDVSTGRVTLLQRALPSSPHL